MYNYDLPTQKTTVYSLPIKVLLVLICCASMNAFNRYFYILFVAFMFFFLYRSRVKINAVAALLFAFTVSLIVFDTVLVTFTFNSLLKQFVFPLSYILGYNLMYKEEGFEDEKTREKLFFAVIFAISLGILVHIVLNVYTNQNADNRSIIDYWTQDSTSATCNAALLCFGVGILPAIFLTETTRLVKIYGVVSVVAFLSFALILAGRTFFVMSLLTFCVVLIYYVVSVDKKSSAVKVIIGAVVVFVIIYLMYQNDTFGIKTAFENSNFYTRFFSDKSDIELTEDGRMEKKALYFSMMFKYMWGGGHLRAAAGTTFAHELYLDTYSRAGIITYIIIVAFVISRTIRVIKLLKETMVSDFIKCLILGLFVSLNMEFMIEPVMEGVPWLLPIFCLLCGMVDYLYESDQGLIKTNTEDETE